jgi:hypothetical protein
MTEKQIGTEECHYLVCDDVWLLLRTYVSEERIAYIIRVERISELGRLAVNSNQLFITLFLAR